MIDWLVQTHDDCPPAERFLGRAERERLAGIAVAKRRGDWLLGRWTAKQLLRAWLRRATGAAPVPAELAILSDPDGAPRVEYSGPTAARLRLSISHAGGRAFCALAAGAGPIGADIERVEARGPAFAADYFTPAELALLGTAPAESYDAVATAIWSAKEAALKLSRHGLSVDTRAVVCLPAGAPAPWWQPVSVLSALWPGPLRGWWRLADGFVLTIVAAAGAGR
jgi:4'-phosphopantetheinyl transferase